MEEKRGPVKRTLQRLHLVSRLEHEIWALVYLQFKSGAAAAASRRRRLTGMSRSSASSLPSVFARGA
jgi:hypothetical protein